MDSVSSCPIRTLDFPEHPKTYVSTARWLDGVQDGQDNSLLQRVRRLRRVHHHVGLVPEVRLVAVAGLNKHQHPCLSLLHDRVQRPCLERRCVQVRDTAKTITLDGLVNQ